MSTQCYQTKTGIQVTQSLKPLHHPAAHIRGLSKKYPTFGGEKYISYMTGLGP